MNKMVFVVDFLVHYGLELFLASLIAFGAKWAKPFFSDEWSESLERLIDFLVICQGWITCPLILLASCMAQQKWNEQVRGALLIFIIISSMLGLLWLASTQRHAFFIKPKYKQVFFRYLPVIFLFSKMAIEFVR